MAEPRYEVNANNEVFIWIGETEEPNLFQPQWPDGTPWADKAEAENWAQQFFATINDPEAPEAPSSPTK